MALRILHLLGGSLESGAGRGALVLHEALLAAGLDSLILGRVGSSASLTSRAQPIGLHKRLPISALNRVHRQILKIKFGALPVDFAPLSFGLQLHWTTAYKRADVIHVQWANASTFGPGLLRALSKESRPVVWTLRDMWPFTGGCHFSGSCERYAEGCGNCPLLGGKSETMTSKDASFKRAVMPNSATFIAISEYMGRMAQRSSVLHGKDIRVIPNAIRVPPSVVAKGEARRRLGLPSAEFILAFGAISLLDRRKGAEIFRKVVEKFGNDKRVHFAVFGNEPKAVVGLHSGNATLFGFLRNDDMRNLIYSAADVFLMPSLQESFGKVTAEAMAAGTPVVAFEGTPAEEIIEHEVTGWLVRHGDADAFVSTLDRAMLVRSSRLVEMGLLGRSEIVARFKDTSVAEKYIALYHERLLVRNEI